MPAEHDDLALLVRPGDLRDRVPGLRLIRELRLQIDFQLDGLLAVEQPRDPLPVLDRHHERGHRRRRVLALPALDALHAERAAVERARLDDRGHLLLHEELAELPLERAAPGELLAVEGLAGAHVGAPGDLVAGEIGEGLLVVALGERLLLRLDLAGLAENQDLAGELPLLLLQVFLLRQLDLDRRRAQGPVRPGAPGQRQREELGEVRRQHPHRRDLVAPAAPEGLPRLQVRVGEPPVRELLARPVVGPLHVRRPRQARADLVHQVARDLHDLRIAEPLLPDLRDHVQVHPLLGGQPPGRASWTRGARGKRLFSRKPPVVTPRTLPRGEAWRQRWSMRQRYNSL